MIKVATVSVLFLRPITYDLHSDIHSEFLSTDRCKKDDTDEVLITANNLVAQYILGTSNAELKPAFFCVITRPKH
jgi:hypothetical protein